MGYWNMLTRFLGLTCREPQNIANAATRQRVSHIATLQRARPRAESQIGLHLGVPPNPRSHPSSNGRLSKYRSCEPAKLMAVNQKMPWWNMKPASRPRAQSGPGRSTQSHMPHSQTNEPAAASRSTQGGSIWSTRSHGKR